MRKASATLLLVVILLLAGCTSEKQFPASAEQLQSSGTIDIDQDGFQEVVYSIYAPYVLDGYVTLQRIVLVSSDRDITFTKYHNLSTDDVKEINAEFEEFLLTKKDMEDRCNLRLGLANLKCIDAKSCAKPCAESNSKCAELVKNNELVIGKYILEYSKDNGEIDPNMDYIQNVLPKLATLSNERKDELATRIAKINSRIASINANPLMREQALALCDPGDFDSFRLYKILQKIGEYNVSITSYNYRIMLKAETNVPQTSLSYNDIEIADTIPVAFAATGITSPQQIKINTSNGVMITWPVYKPYLDRETLLAYEFASNLAPDQAGFQKPEVVSKTLNLNFANPAIGLFNTFRAISRNYYVALGATGAALFALVWLIASLVIIGYHAAMARLAKESPYSGIRKAIGKTTVRWKSDLMFAIFLLAVGSAGAYVFGPSSPEEFNLFLTEELLLEPSAFMATLFVFAGAVFLFSALDNILRLKINERTYLQRFKEEKVAFKSRVDYLKERLHELGDIVEEYGKQNFDVGSEYDLLTRISLGHVDELGELADDHSKKLIENYADQVDAAINGLNQKRKVAEQNWPVWNNAIANELGEKNEVYAANMIGIPATLRNWALGKYVAENPDMGFVFEGDAIRKRQVNAQDMTRNLLDKSLLLGAVVIKDGKLAFSRMADGSSTVPGIFALKLLKYLRSLGAKMNIADYDSVAVVGEKDVMALIKYRNIESVIFMQKEKFKEAIEDWKSKIKGF